MTAATGKLIVLMFSQIRRETIYLKTTFYCSYMFFYSQWYNSNKAFYYVHRWENLSNRSWKLQILFANCYLELRNICIYIFKKSIHFQLVLLTPFYRSSVLCCKPVQLELLIAETFLAKARIFNTINMLILGLKCLLLFTKVGP